MNGPIRVVLADDHQILLAGLKKVIEAEHDLHIVGEATTGGSALKLIREEQPDVAVLDISMPEISGIMVARRAAQEHPSVRVIVLSVHEDRAYVNEAIKAGVRAYVLKRSAAENLIRAIRAVAVGGLYVDPALTGQPFLKPDSYETRRSTNRSASELTERELQVFKLLAVGHTNKEIARQLDIGVKSVETYKARAAENWAHEPVLKSFATPLRRVGSAPDPGARG